LVLVCSPGLAKVKVRDNCTVLLACRVMKPLLALLFLNEEKCMLGEQVDA
jgi:hypothetical protein